jgi:threonine/homoserine/homoserine lactone efflux protein
MWQIYLFGLAVGLGVVVTPGPINFEIVRRSLAFGPRFGIAFGFGALSADMCYLTAISLGASALLTALPNWGKAIMLLVAAGLLTWIGLKAVRAKVADEAEMGRKEIKAAEESAGTSGGRLSSSYVLGLALTLSNPATIGFWCAVSLTAASRLQGTVIRTLTLMAGVATAAAFWTCAISLIAGRFHRTIAPRTQVVVERSTGAVLCLFAALSAFGAIRTLLR